MRMILALHQEFPSFWFCLRENKWQYWWYDSPNSVKVADPGKSTACTICFQSNGFTRFSQTTLIGPAWRCNPQPWSSGNRKTIFRRAWRGSWPSKTPFTLMKWLRQWYEEWSMRISLSRCQESLSLMPKGLSSRKRMEGFRLFTDYSIVNKLKECPEEPWRSTKEEWGLSKDWKFPRF